MRPKFAVVREDAEIEARLVERFGAKRILLVASAGCTALTLAARDPSLNITLYDFNPAQFELLDRKLEALDQPERWNVGGGQKTDLREHGDFEGLFRVLRHFLQEFVDSPAAFTQFFDEPEAEKRRRTVAEWSTNPYWPVAFRLAFDHTFLDVMFTPAATQHAAPGSYPRYFQQVIERGLNRDAAASNPFLQHILLGHFRKRPPYLGTTPPTFERVLGGLPDVPALDRFDLIHLSNIFDWMEQPAIESWCAALQDRCKPGAVIVNRQLNNKRRLEATFRPHFRFDEGLGDTLQRADRSLFYNRIMVGVHQGRRR